MGWTKIERIGQSGFFFVRLEIVFGFKVGIRVCGLGKGRSMSWEDVMGEEDKANKKGDDEPYTICYTEVASAKAREFFVV